MILKKMCKNTNISIFCNDGHISTMHILRTEGLMTILQNIFVNALAMRIFVSITLSEFFTENFTKVMIFSKIDTLSSIFSSMMVVEPISLLRTRSQNSKFGHI